MATRSDPTKQRFPAFKGKIIVDTYRGKLRTRSWPRKTGTPKSETVRSLNTWFTSANRMAKQLLPSQQVLAIALAKGTGLYPRDLLVKSIYGGMFDIATEDGRLIQHRVFQLEDVMFQGAILQLTSNQVIPGTTETQFVWPLPVLDTAGFWDITQPKRLTIPQGVEVIALTGSWAATANVGSFNAITALRRNLVRVTRDVVTINTQGGATTARGALVVEEGDIIDLSIFPVKAFTAQGNQQTALTLQVLQAQ